MQDGRIVETGPAWLVLTTPGQVCTQRLMAAVPGAATRGRWLAATGDAPLRETVASEQRPLLEVDGVAVGFKRPDGRALDARAEASLVIRRGETLGIVGESGSGKTTLGKVALALQPPDRGEVRFEGRPWSRLSESARRPLRSRIQTIVQDPLGSFDPRYTVERIIEQPLRLPGDLRRKARRDRISELIDLVILPSELLPLPPA